MTKDVRKTISGIVGTYLKEVRKTKDLSLDAVSEKIGVSRSMIAYIESFKRLPSVRVLRSYARAFELDEMYLLDLREKTIFETVALLGEDAPLAIRNERNMIAHSYDRKSRMSVIREQSSPEDLSVRDKHKASMHADMRSRRAEERAKAERSILEVDGIEITDEEYEAAIDFIRQRRLEMIER